MERFDSPILVCGLYRSGTNYLQAIIDDLLDNDVSSYIQYKHEFVTSDIPYNIRKINRIIVHKAPYKWVDSLVSQCWELGDHYKVNYEVGHTPIKCGTNKVLQDTPDIIEEYRTFSLENICNLYNRFFSYWLSNPFLSRLRFIKYTDLLIDPQKTLGFINDTGEIRNLPKKVRASYEFTENRKRMALSPYMTYNIDLSLSAVLEKNIDRDIIRALGYSGVFE